MPQLSQIICDNCPVAAFCKSGILFYKIYKMKYLSNSLVKLLFLLLLISGFPRYSKAQQSKDRILPQPGYYNVQVGDIQVVVLSDGTNLLDMNELLLNAKPGQIQRSFQQIFLKTNVEVSINGYLIRTASKLVLIDAGSGDLLGPTLGQLTKSLANAGFRPEQIDAVIITHMHPDHVGGLISQGEIAFPNATVYVEKSETDFWLSEQNNKNAPEGAKPFFTYARNSILPYKKAGKLKTFDSDAVIFPGIRSLASVGHTPGHTSFAIESKGQKLLVLGDLIHAAAVQFADPGVTIKFDGDAKTAVKSRKLIFDQAVKGRYLVAGSHLSFPGIGRIKANGVAYIWVPANYSTIVVN